MLLLQFLQQGTDEMSTGDRREIRGGTRPGQTQCAPLLFQVLQRNRGNVRSPGVRGGTR